MGAGPLGSVFGENSFYLRNIWCKTRWVAILLNVVLTPASLPRSQTSGTGRSATCWCCWYYFPLCPTGGRYPGKIRFIQPKGGGNGYRRSVPGSPSSGRFIEPGGDGPMRRLQGAPSSGSPRESQANFKGGTLWGL